MVDYQLNNFVNAVTNNRKFSATVQPATGGKMLLLRSKPLTQAKLEKVSRLTRMKPANMPKVHPNSQKQSATTL